MGEMHTFEIHGGPSGRDLTITLDGQPLKDVKGFSLSCDGPGDLVMLDIKLAVLPVGSVKSTRAYSPDPHTETLTFEGGVLVDLDDGRGPQMVPHIAITPPEKMLRDYDRPLTGLGGDVVRH